MGLILEKLALNEYEDLEKLGDNQDEIESMLEIMLLYSERHMTRNRRYLKKSFYLDFVLDQSKRPGY